MQATLHRSLRASAIALAAAGAAFSAQAELVNITVSVQNLAPLNSIAFTTLNVGFGNGSFDAFNMGQVAPGPIALVAERGIGTDWQAAFAAADPNAVRGTVGGRLLAGETASMSFTIDTSQQGLFSYASMVIPSNDFFIGNDNAVALFDAQGNLAVSSITLRARNIWDAGTEVFDPAAAAFVGNSALRTDQNSVVALNFAELAAFNGMTTAAGYVFNSGLTAASEVYRISFAVAPVPEPGSLAMLTAGLLGIGFLASRRRAAAAAGTLGPA